MSKVLTYINIIAILLLLFAGFDKILNWQIITSTGMIFVIFTAAIFLLITTFLQLTMKDN